MKLSILIVNYNTEQYIHDLLVSIDKQSMPKTDYEIIISNNNQNNNLIQMLELSEVTQKLDVRVVQLEKNVGFGRAMNEAAQLSSGEHLLVINPDVLLNDPEYLIEMLRFIASNHNYGVITSKVYNDKGEYKNDRYRYEFFDNLGYKDEVCWFQGSLLFIRSNIFKEVHGFDKDYFMYCEDEDLCYRIKNKGYPLIKNNQLSFYHKGGVSEPSQDYSYYYRHFKSMLLFMHKHKDELVFNQFIKELDKKSRIRKKRYFFLSKLSTNYTIRALKAQVMYELTQKTLKSSASWLYFDE